MDPFQHVRERGYHSFGAYLKRRFGCKVHKVSLHAGLTCPNRDGTVGRGGCTYCVNESFSPQAGRPLPGVREQMINGMAYMRRRFKARRFIAYFQAFTNTYAPLPKLRELYDAVVDLPGVVGLSIGTRPDCVPDETLDLVTEYVKDREVWLEYGIQSAHDRTLRSINRGHGFACFTDAMARTLGRGIKVCAHVILGLSGETREDMVETAVRVNATGIHGIKIHHLYIARGTRMADDYQAGEVRVLSAEDYVPIVCDFLERLHPGVTIQRLVGDTTSSDVLIAPVWPQTKTQVFQMITDEFRRRGSWQGSRCADMCARAVGQ